MTSINQTATQPAWSYSAIQIVTIGVDAVSVLTCLVNVVVFSTLVSKDQIYKFLLIASIVDFLYLGIGVFLLVFTPMCDPTPIRCGSDSQFISKVVSIWITAFLNPTFAFYSILNEIFLSVQRLFILRKKLFMKDLKVWYVAPVLYLISVLYYMPVLLTQSVKQAGPVSSNGMVYHAYTVALAPNAASIVGMVQALIRALLVTVGMTGLNACTIYNFRAFIKQKSKIRSSSKPIKGPVDVVSTKTNETSQTTVSRGSVGETSDHRANKNITIMLISTSTLYVIGTIPYMVFIMMTYLTTVKIPPIFVSCAYICIILYIGLKMVVYYTCNKFYRETLNEFFKMILALIK